MCCRLRVRVRVGCGLWWLWFFGAVFLGRDFVCWDSIGVNRIFTHRYRGLRGEGGSLIFDRTHKTIPLGAATAVAFAVASTISFLSLIHRASDLKWRAPPRWRQSMDLLSLFSTTLDCTQSSSMEASLFASVMASLPSLVELCSRPHYASCQSLSPPVRRSMSVAWRSPASFRVLFRSMAM